MTPTDYAIFAGSIMGALALLYFIAPKRWR